MKADPDLKAVWQGDGGPLASTSEVLCLEIWELHGISGSLNGGTVALWVPPHPPI